MRGDCKVAGNARLRETGFQAARLVTTVPDQLVATRLTSNHEKTRSKSIRLPLV